MSEINNINPLTEIPTNDLVDELVRRCSPAIFLGYKNEGGNDGMMTFFEWDGADAVCYGLCHQMAYHIQQEMINRGDDASD